MDRTDAVPSLPSAIAEHELLGYDGVNVALVLTLFS
jgi:hypothetical protein